MNYIVDHTLPNYVEPTLKQQSEFLTVNFNQLTQLFCNMVQRSRESTLCLRNLEMAHFYAQKALDNPTEPII
jgi:hypothetical protein